MALLLRPRVIAGLTVAAVAVVACVISTTTRPIALRTTGKEQIVLTPLKAHLVDGSVVVFPTGAEISTVHVAGPGQRFDASRTSAQQAMSIPLDSVLGFETYERHVNPLRTLVFGSATLAASIVGAAALAVVIFGSCPTIYADSAGHQVLQAESFSNSIAPLLARRDLDRLIVSADASGKVRLDVRNEALETHYIDHLDLVEFRHRSDEMVLPATPEGVIAVSDLLVPTAVRDGAGREVRDVVGVADEIAFSTDDGYLGRAIDGGPVEDHLDVTSPRSAVDDTLALVLRVRASLLSTSVLYHYMLGKPGASALDWMGRDLSSIATLAKLASWYADNFGLRVSVRRGNEWKPLARMVNFGPVAWRSIGVIVPVVGEDSIHLRLSFLADEFRVDHIGIARHVRVVEPRTIPITRITGADGQARADARKTLLRADGRDLETHPGDRFFAEFDVGHAAPDTRTFMVASEGYYTEWVRTSWIRTATDSVSFSPSRVTTRDLLRTWRASKDTLEQRFFTRRVPIV